MAKSPVAPNKTMSKLLSCAVIAEPFKIIVQAAFFVLRGMAVNVCRQVKKQPALCILLKVQAAFPYSHSIVAGGLPLTSYTTRLMPRTSLMMRLDTLPKSE